MKTFNTLITRAVLAIIVAGFIFQNSTEASVLSVSIGQPIKLEVSASGTQPFSYQWRKNGTAISGATSACYAIAATTTSDSATYSAVVTNSVGTTISDDAVLTVYTGSGLVELTPATTSARGENAPAEGIAQLFDGQSTTKWLDFSGTSWIQVTFAKPSSLQAYSLTSGNDMPERDPTSWTLSGSNDGVTWVVIESRTSQSWSSRNLVRDFVLTSASAAYTRFRFDTLTNCSITQLSELELYGTTGASLVLAPTITNQPVSLTVTEGLPASFSVTASGTATLSYQWLKNGTVISGATNSTYSIGSTTASDAANYTVVVTNAAGSATSNIAVLTIKPVMIAPAITTQPASLTVTAGQPASFTIGASGSATLTYQWLKNGAIISGATSASYTIAATVGSDAATYTVTVTNSAGYATSTNVELTVNSGVSLAILTPQTYSARGQNGTTESIVQLFDNNSSTKWLDFSATSWVTTVFATPTVLEAYSLTSANDMPERDPASWTLSGSNDGTNWTIIETRTGQTWSSRCLIRNFVLAAPSGAYTQFRFDLQASSGSITQLADLELFGNSVVSVALTPKSYSARGQINTSQGIAKLFDGKTTTKWADAKATSWVKVTLSTSSALRRYILTSAADTPTSDPASWTLSGSNDGINWTTIETRVGQTWSSRSLAREFVIPAVSNCYSQYRFDFQVASGTSTQLSELKLYGTP